MMNALRAACLLVAFVVSACGSAPPQPAAISRYDRDMRKAEEVRLEGRLPEAAAIYRSAITYGERHDDSARLAPALLGLAGVALELEDFAVASRGFEEARREATRAGLGDLQQAARIGSAETARRQGDCRTAAGAAEEVLRAATDLSLHWRAQLLLANCRLADGDAVAAMGILDALPAGKAPAPHFEAARLASRAAALLADGKAALAKADATSALATDKAWGYPPAIAADHALLARIAAASGDKPTAGLHANRADRIYRHTGQLRAAEKLQPMLR